MIRVRMHLKLPKYASKTRGYVELKEEIRTFYRDGKPKRQVSRSTRIQAEESK